MSENKRITWINFFFPLCILMGIITFVFFAPLITMEVNNGKTIQCSILELLKIQGLYGTAESLMYFVFGWGISFLLDKFLVQKIAKRFTKEQRTLRMKEKREYKEEKLKEKNNETLLELEKTNKELLEELDETKSKLEYIHDNYEIE